MSGLDRKREEISALVTDIAELQREMGPCYVRQASDREAFDIVARIERKLLASSKAAE